MNEANLEKTFKTVRENDKGGVMDSCFSFVKNAIESNMKPDDRKLLRIFEESENLSLPENYPEEKRQQIMKDDIFVNWRNSIINSAEKYIEYQQGKITQEEMNQIDEERENWRLKLRQELL